MPPRPPDVAVAPEVSFDAVQHTGSAAAVESMLQIGKCQETILDTTYGSGVFWTGSNRLVFGCDTNPSRAKDLVADFRNLPFVDGEFPTVVYDPPFHPFVGSGEEDRYSGMGTTDKELKVEFLKGLLECWRVTSRHLLVKCQGYIHNHAPQWMPLWCVTALGEPFEWMVVTRDAKRTSGRWVTVRSLRRKHADYLLFDKKGNKR